MNSNNKETFSLLALPEEIILHIATFLTTTELFQGLACTCWYLNNLVCNASSYGNVANALFLSNISYLKLNEQEQHSLTQHIVECCTPFKAIDFQGFDDHNKLLNNIIQHASKKNPIKELTFER